jgi:hypothetical protein
VGRDKSYGWREGYDDESVLACHRDSGRCLTGKKRLASGYYPQDIQAHVLLNISPNLCSTVRNFDMLYNTLTLEVFSTFCSHRNHRPTCAPGKAHGDRRSGCPYHSETRDYDLDYDHEADSTQVLKQPGSISFLRCDTFHT